MEAPKPITLITPKIDNDNSKKINLKIKEKPYNLILSKNEGKNTIAIFVSSSEPFLDKNYKADFSLASLQKLSQYFNFFESLDDIINFFHEYFTTKNNTSFNFENNKLIINLEINNLVDGKDMIKIELCEEKKS